MSKGIVALNKEIRKKEFEATPLGQAQKKLKRFYADNANMERMTEEAAEWAGRVFIPGLPAEPEGPAARLKIEERAEEPEVSATEARAETRQQTESARPRRGCCK